MLNEKKYTYNNSPKCDILKKIGDAMIKIYLNKNEYEAEKGITVKDFLASIDYKETFPVLLARYENELKELNESLTYDGTLTPISYDTKEGSKTYINSLVFLLLASIKDLYGNDNDVEVEHSIDKGLYIKTSFNLTEEKLNTIKDKMKELVNENKEIRKITVSRMDAIRYYKMIGDESKALNLKYNTNTYVTLYKLESYYDYFYSKMPVETKNLGNFDLTYINSNSLVLRFPTVYSNGKIPEYHTHTSMMRAFDKSYLWNNTMNVHNASDLNEIVSSGKIDDLIRICENNLNSEILEVARKIKDENKKVVLMAGPSSSGKTTSSKKLCLALESLGIRPVVLSMDDYFVERDDTPKDENGKFDFECLEAVDLKLFDSQIKSLIEGEEVLLPTYNFVTGEKEYKKKEKMEENAILVIEGIHALDNKVLTEIERNKKYKIYVCPLTELNIDNHNRVSTTDNRLLRRIVRDQKTRGKTATYTISAWNDVRRGEEKYIFPYQDEADYTLNTALLYEIGVIKTYVEPLLYKIDEDSEYYDEAKRLLNLLRNFLSIPADALPSDSIIREFIGGSCFKD